MTFFLSWNWWLSVSLWYLQWVRNGDTRILHRSIWMNLETRIWFFLYCLNCAGTFAGTALTKHFNTLRPRQNGCLFADDTFKRIFLNENVRISIKISLKFVPKGPINNIPALVQIMAWRQSGDKPLSEPMMVSLLTHICVTQPQWVNILRLRQHGCHFADNIFKCIF